MAPTRCSGDRHVGASRAGVADVPAVGQKRPARVSGGAHLTADDDVRTRRLPAYDLVPAGTGLVSR